MPIRRSLALVALTTLCSFSTSRAALGRSSHPFPPNTWIGDNLTVPLAHGVEVTFLKVTSEGETSPNFNYAPWELSYPKGFRPPHDARAFDLSTTAGYQGPITVSYRYDNAKLTAAQEENLRFIESIDGQWTDVTKSLDPTEKKITATIRSLGTLALAIRDRVPPSRVVDLLAAEMVSGSVGLTWTAPGEDNDAGEAQSYDVRFATFPITDANFDAAIDAEYTRLPQRAGAREGFQIPDMSPAEKYYFALKTVDHAGNMSALSHNAFLKGHGAPVQTRSAILASRRAAGTGDLAVTVRYPAGFSGGELFFYGSPTPDFWGHYSGLGSLSAPVSGTVFKETIRLLPAPATYFVAVVYDPAATEELTVVGSFEKNPGLPAGGAAFPVLISSGGVAALPEITLTVDRKRPEVSILRPVSNSPITASSFLLSGTASDDTGINAIGLSVHDLTDDTWWEPDGEIFVPGPVPPWRKGVTMSGAWGQASWRCEGTTLAKTLIPGRAYEISAEVIDPSGNTAIATAVVTSRRKTGP